MQKGGAISYASQVLRETENNYAQTEKEIPAIAFTTKKCHQSLYGAQVEAQSDHKLLEVIFSKLLGKASARLQCMLLQLQKYDLKVARALVKTH